MARKVSKEEYIQRASDTHNHKYDYSRSDYTNARTDIIIICPIHGDYTQNAGRHLYQKHGCPKCYIDSKKKLVYGFGYNDLCEKRNSPLRSTWMSMLCRCYSLKMHKKSPTYIGCSVCDDWKSLSGFKLFFDEHYIDGYHLDKDILKKGNKIYCTQYCSFVPLEINNLILRHDANRGEYPIGVTYSSKYRKFVAHIRKSGACIHIGYFNTPGDAFIAYKLKKESYIKELADKFFQNNQIEKRVYDALIKYEVEPF